MVGLTTDSSSEIYLISSGNSGSDSGNFDLESQLKPIKETTSDISHQNIRLYYEAQLSQKDTFIVDMEAESPLHYDSTTGRIHINPKHQGFEFYDLRQSIAHEIGHKIQFDVMEGLGDEFVSVIQQAMDTVETRLPYFLSLIENDDIFNNMIVSDILSALSKSNIEGAFGHKKEYWEIDGRIEAEIFANMFSATVVNDELALKFFEDEFKNLFSIFKKLF